MRGTYKIKEELRKNCTIRNFIIMGSLLYFVGVFILFILTVIFIIGKFEFFEELKLFTYGAISVSFIVYFIIELILDNFNKKIYHLKIECYNEYKNQLRDINEIIDELDK